MIYKILIKPMVESHLSYGTFAFDSENDNIAKTIFGFMIRSVFGS